jgi:hypothetical protein
MRKTFGKASVVIAHHMVKRSKNPRDNVTLMDNMRLFSDMGRGSGAIKGYCDVIVNQEWFDEDGEEVIHWGAFGKNIPDLSPRALSQTAPNSNLWAPTNLDHITETVKASLTVLREHAPNLFFESRAEAARLVMRARDVSRSTANDHVDKLIVQDLIRVRQDKKPSKKRPRLMFNVPS